MHVDNFRIRISGEIEAEIEKISKLKKVYVVYRGQLGETLKDMLEEILMGLNPIFKKVENSIEGVSISLKDREIKFYNSTSSIDIIHHPQEQQILTLQKIKQLIGLRAMEKTGQIHAIPIDIFSHCRWRVYEDSLEIDQSHYLTKEEMAIFSNTDSLFEMERKLEKIFKKLQQAGIVFQGRLENDMHYIRAISPYMERYLNKYDYNIPFIRNIKNSIQYHEKKAIQKKEFTKKDKIFKDKLENALSGFSGNADVITTLLQEQQKEGSDFSKNIVKDYKIFYENYLFSKKYEGFRQLNIKNKKHAYALATKGGEHYRESQYNAAINLLAEALVILTASCLDSEPILATVYYNLGRTQLMLGKYEEALSTLRMSVELRSNLTVVSKEDVEKAKNALLECEKKLEVQSSNTKPTPSV